MELIKYWTDKSKKLIEETVQGYQYITQAFFDEDYVQIEMTLLHLYGIHIKIRELLKDIKKVNLNHTILKDEVRTLTLFEELLNGSQKLP